MKLRIYSLLLVVLVGGLVFPSNAHAYIDASTGAMLIQMLLGGLAGLVVALRFYGKRLWSKFTGKPPSEENTESDQENVE